MSSDATSYLTQFQCKYVVHFLLLSFVSHSTGEQAITLAPSSLTVQVNTTGVLTCRAPGLIIWEVNGLTVTSQSIQQELQVLGFFAPIGDEFISELLIQTPILLPDEIIIRCSHNDFTTIPPLFTSSDPSSIFVTGELPVLVCGGHYAYQC